MCIFPFMSSCWEDRGYAAITSKMNITGVDVVWLSGITSVIKE